MVSPDFRHMPARAEALTATLWRERELMDQLLFALTSQRLILEANALRWLTTSSAQVCDIVETLRAHELLRAIAADDLAAELGLQPSPTLRELAAHACTPHDLILNDLSVELGELAAEIEATVRANDELLLALVGPDQQDRTTGVAP